MASHPVSLLVITHNEEHTIGRCLDSVPFASEKLVVDSESDDLTRQAAEQHGARVVRQPWLGFGLQRRFATERAGHDWILFLDADETLTPESVAEFEERLPAILASDAPGALLPRSAWYMGAPMRWYRPMVGELLGRFYHRKRAQWTEARVHESLVFDGTPLRFRRPFLHHHSPTLVHKQLKVLRYSELWALERAGRGRRTTPWSWPLIYLASFFKDYVLRLAALDGGRGLTVAHIAASYAVYKRARLFELSRNPDSTDSARRVLERHDLWR